MNVTLTVIRDKESRDCHALYLLSALQNYIQRNSTSYYLLNIMLRITVKRENFAYVAIIMFIFSLFGIGPVSNVFFLAFYMLSGVQHSVLSSREIYLN